MLKFKENDLNDANLFENNHLITKEEPIAAYILANCCQIIVCESCITKTVNSKKNFIKRCPNCAQ